MELNKLNKIKKVVVTAISVASLSGCVFLGEKNPCEDIEEIQAQERRCETLKKQILLYKNRPVTRTTLDDQYQKECVELRYYRDTYKDQPPCRKIAPNQDAIKPKSAEAKTQ